MSACVICMLRGVSAVKSKVSSRSAVNSDIKLEVLVTLPFLSTDPLGMRGACY